MRNTFQKGIDQLKRQQQILTALGFYRGAIDGIWGPSSIAAMAKFEADPSFLPGIPNHGMPLSEGGAYPAGIYKDPLVSRGQPMLLTHILVQEAEAKAVKPAADDKKAKAAEKTVIPEV